MTDEQELKIYYEQQKLINDYADQVRNIFDIEVPIMNMEEVVFKIGGTVKYDGKCSYIEKHNKSFIIHIGEYESSNIKNFRIAQQLAKLFLYTSFVSGYNLFADSNDITLKDSYYRDGAINWINEFAYALLMPMNDFIKEVDKNTNDNIVDTKIIAEYFGVSISCASERGKRLRLFKD